MDPLQKENQPDVRAAADTGGGSGGNAALGGGRRTRGAGRASGVGGGSLLVLISANLPSEFAGLRPYLLWAVAPVAVFFNALWDWAEPAGKAYLERRRRAKFLKDIEQDVRNLPPNDRREVERWLYRVKKKDIKSRIDKFEGDVLGGPPSRKTTRSIDENVIRNQGTSRGKGSEEFSA